MSTALLSILSGIAGMFGWGIYDFLGGVYSIGYLFFFKGFEMGNVSIVAATMNLWAVFTMLFAFIFMGQRLSTMQTLGVFMIISGVTLASLNWREIKNHSFKLSLGVRETVLGA